MQNNQINQQAQEINPWILAENDAKKKSIDELKILIHRASFIEDEKEKNWIALLPYFSEDFLGELKQMIIRESLRHLDGKHRSRV